MKYTLEDPEGELRLSSILSLTSALNGDECKRHALAALPPGKSTVSHFKGGWEGPRTCLDGNGKSRSNQISILRPSSPY